MSFRRPSVGLALAALAALVVVALAGGCVDHPVGPARTFGQYEGTAVTTAEAALSAVATAQLVATTASSGNSFGPYAGTVLGEAEGTASGVQGTFASIQPPGERADDLRDELDQQLGDAVDHQATLRIAARRGQLADLERLAGPLDDDAAALDAFIEAHR
jgi:hypothetical protein